jgi:lysozyme
MKLNKKGLDLITSFEGFSHKPYLCPAGVPTIGYGTTVYPSGKRVTLRDPSITRQQGLDYKMSDIRKIEGDLILALDVKLSEIQRFSLLCLQSRYRSIPQVHTPQDDQCRSWCAWYP